MIATPAALDTAPLVQSLTTAEINQAYERMPLGTAVPYVSRAGAYTISLALIAGLAVVFVATAFGIPYLLGRGDADGLSLSVVVVPLGIIAVTVVVWIVGIRRARHADRARAVRLNHFARVNGMTYRGVIPRDRPGMMFRFGGIQRGEVLALDTGRTWEISNVERLSPAGGTRKDRRRWGVVAVQLSNSLPHIFLDARGNNSIVGRSGLPDQMVRGQRLSLEGDFDRYFTLYCPAGYERAALYLFTPDIMAMMIDRFAELDVEIVDDWLSSTRIVTSSRSTPPCGSGCWSSPQRWKPSSHSGRDGRTIRCLCPTVRRDRRTRQR